MLRVYLRIISLWVCPLKLFTPVCLLGSHRHRIGPKSEETLALRQKIAIGCEQLIWDFFNGGGQVVIYDANNGTKAQRQSLAEKFDKEGIHVVMLGTSRSALGVAYRSIKGILVVSMSESLNGLRVSV